MISNSSTSRMLCRPGSHLRPQECDNLQLILVQRVAIQIALDRLRVQIT